MATPPVAGRCREIAQHGRPCAIPATSLRGDLETIVQKTLSKDPTRRYQGAGELAGDIQRHLDSKPIDARRDSTIYVLRKYVSRNRRGLG